MTTPPAPAQLAKAALRRLAIEKLEPTPENYQRAYLAEAGVEAPKESGKDAPAAPEAVAPDFGLAAERHLVLRLNDIVTATPGLIAAGPQTVQAILDFAAWEALVHPDDLPAIGERVMDGLRELDDVAYVRFASVYREFKDARDFVDELEPILNESARDGSI